MADCMDRSLSLPLAPPEAWEKCFSSAQALAAWFPDRVEGELALGGTFWMIWGEHRCECRLVEFQEPSLFAYQWHPGEAAALSDFPREELTTVQFALVPEGPGTRVVMRESGFDSIPEPRRSTAWALNEEGWGDELPKLLKACHTGGGISPAPDHSLPKI